MSEQSHLPAEISTDTPNNRVIPAEYPSTPSTQIFEPKAPTVSLLHYLWILRRHFWKIAAFVAACSLAALIVSMRLKPIYESTATIVVDLGAPSEVVGQGSTSPANTLDPDVFMATQVKLIQSDAVLRPVAEQFHLVSSSTNESSKAGGDLQTAARAPVSLGGLKVTRPTNTYLLLINYRASDSQVAADIANAIANSYLAHTYDIRVRSSASLSLFMEKQLDELKAKMERSSMALSQFEKDLEVVNPEEKTNILSARLLQLNTEYTTAQAERVRAEADWTGMKSGSVEAAEVSAQGGSLTGLATILDQARQRLAEAKSTYGVNHPEYRKAAAELAEVEKEFEDARRNISDRIETAYRESLNREQMLQKAVADTKAQWDLVNTRSFQYQQLKQEADADRALYDELIKKISEADINTGFRDNNIRLADVARPELGPVYPNIRMNLLMALIFSSLLAIGTVVALDSLDTTIRDPEVASRFLGIDVIGTLPLDRNLGLVPKVASSEPTGAAIVSDGLDSNENGHRPKGFYPSISGFEEAVRTIRNTILLSDFEQRLRSIVVTSSDPGEGKTTLSVHLACAFAAGGKKTLLVDGDLRRPSIHARFALTALEGLSNVLTGAVAWQDVVLPVAGVPNLRVLSAGPGSHRAADLIGPRLAELLDEFAKEYDMVILDSPPLLGFAECLQMANAADGVVIVSRAGETRRQAVATVVLALHRLRANIIGLVLNQVTNTTTEDGYTYYGRYRYGYYKETR